MIEYKIKQITKKDFEIILEKHGDEAFEDVHHYSYKDLFGDQLESYDLEKPLGTPYELYLVAFGQNDEVLGWTWGRQENATTFYMINSAVIKEYRRQGIYSALIQNIINTVTEKDYQIIYSRHNATNNSVIIPKLKNGFVISKMEISDKYGILIHLSYFCNQLRREIFDYRAGQSKPSEQIKKILKI